MPTVQLPNGQTASFPDGMSPQDIQHAIESDGSFGAKPAAPQPAPTGAMNGLKQGFSDLGEGIASLPHALMNPRETMQGINDQSLALQDRAKQEWNSGHKGNAIWHGIDSVLPVIGPMDAALTDQYQGGDKSGAMTRGLVNALPYALPHVANEVAAPLGEGMKNAGAKMIDHTVGVRKGDVLHGAQPGRAYLEGGGGPALSMRGIANQSSKIANAAGEELGNKYQAATDSGTRIPAEQVHGAISPTLNKALEIKRGPGGTGDVGQLEGYANSFRPMLQQGWNEGGITPNDLWAAKKNVAANTRWNDPTQFDLNKVRQMNTGAMGGLLADNVPGAARLNKVFQGTTNLARRAGERADTGQSPLTSIGKRVVEGAVGAGLSAATHNPALALLPLAADSVPVRTSLAKGLFVGGGATPALTPIAKTIGPLAGVSGVKRPKVGPNDDR